MVEEATVDCYDEDEQVGGLFAMIEDKLSVPFESLVLGVEVTVASVDLVDSGQIVAISNAAAPALSTTLRGWRERATQSASASRRGRSSTTATRCRRRSLS